MINWFIAAIFVFFLVSFLLSLPTDDTDKSFFKRSGMSLYTDYKTGLQYLGASSGGLIPRLDENGKHMRNTSK